MTDKNLLSGLLLEGTRQEGGKLTFVNRMRIDGEFVGEIESKDQLIVGKNGVIKADLRVAQLVVAGTVEGTISDCDLLEIQEGGRVLADIKVKTLDIKPGAVYEGRCTMITEASEGQK